MHELTGRGTRRSALDVESGRSAQPLRGTRARAGRARRAPGAGARRARGQVGRRGGRARGREVAARARAAPRRLVARGVTLLEGRCLSYGAAIPYLPVLDLLRAACGVGRDRHARTGRGARARAASSAAGVSARERAAYLLHLLGVKADGDPLAALGPERDHGADLRHPPRADARAWRGASRSCSSSRTSTGSTRRRKRSWPRWWSGWRRRRSCSSPRIVPAIGRRGWTGRTPPSSRSGPSGRRTAWRS